MAVTELHLQDHLTRLSLAPELGASLVNWEVKATGQALLRHSDPAALARRTATFCVLASNTASL